MGVGFGKLLNSSEGEWMIFDCLIDKVFFCLLIEFHGTFTISYKTLSSGTFAGILRSLSINRRAKTEVKNIFN